MSIEDWDEQINTNLRASFLLTRLFVNRMIENKDTTSPLEKFNSLIEPFRLLKNNILYFLFHL